MKVQLQAEGGKAILANIDVGYTFPYHATTSLLPSATAASSLEINFSQNMSGISFNSSFEGSDKSDVMIGHPYSCGNMLDCKY